VGGNGEDAGIDGRTYVGEVHAEDCGNYETAAMHLVSVVSARPNFVKLAAIVHALREKCPQAKHTIIHTGQHYDPIFSGVFFEQLKIPRPDKNLDAHEAGGSLAQIGVTMEKLESFLSVVRPDAVLVYGDVNGAFSAAFIAQRCNVPVAHIEAGLRSFDRNMPEEVNRLLIDHVSTLLFVSEPSGVDNLRREGISEGVYFVGNTMIDTLQRMQHLIQQQQIPSHFPGRFGLVTLHRPGNVDEREQLQRCISFFNSIANVCPLVFPVHLRTKAMMERHGLYRTFSPRVRILDPLGYLSFLKVLSEAAFVLTDSGGVQEEATFLGKKCFTLRRSTERPSTVDAGSNELVDLQSEAQSTHVLAFASYPVSLKISLPEKWDGKAGIRIVQHLVSFLS
jgi:UDP-N-acetylglucosamine 2-epimerase (non-hydrolysing)